MAELKSVGIYRTARQPAPLSVLGYGTHTITTWLADRRLDSHAAVLVQEGAGMLLSARAGRLELIAPALFWLFPGEQHAYGPAPGTAWQERWVLFGGSLCSYFVDGGLIDPARPLVALSELTPVASLFGAIHSAIVDETPLGPAAGGVALHRLAVEVARQQRPAAVPADGPDADVLAATLRARAFEPIDFAAFADEFGMSPATLRRRFVSRFGVAPKAMQLDIRLDRAKALLAASDDSIEQIAERVGFTDSYYFSRVFRLREGRSPSEFRLRNRRR